MNILTLTYLGLAVFVVLLVIWRTRKVRSTFGSAGWLTPWAASGQGLFSGGDILAGDWTGLLPVYYRGDGHVLTVAQTGGGKGTSAILPNLLHHPWLFVLDPGGENTAVAVSAWRAKGYEIFCLNPWGMYADEPWALPQHAINPLDILDAASESFASDADLLASMIITRTRYEGEPFFKDQAQAAIRAVLMHIVTTEPSERRNLVTLRHSLVGDAQGWENLIAAMRANPACDGMIAREAAQLERREAQSPEEFSGVISTIKQDTDFIEDPVMKRALCAGSCDLSALKGTLAGRALSGCAVSVIIPLPYINTHAAYARLVLAAALWTMQRPPLASNRVFFVLDEFPALGHVRRVVSGLAELRKYNVCLWPVIQNLGQLVSLYGSIWETFLSNAGMKQFIGASDLETARYISALCGEGTIEVKTTTGDGRVTKSETRRILATPDEIMTLSARAQIVLFDNLRPMILLKTPYWERPELRGTYLRNPYKGMKSMTWHAPLRAAWGSFFRFCAWLVRPSPYAVMAAVMMVLILADASVYAGGGLDRRTGILACRHVGVSGVTHFRMRVDRRIGCPAVLLWNNGLYWLED